MVFCCLVLYCVAKSFFCDLRCFIAKLVVTIHALLRGEKFSQKVCLWRKNDKYQVCACVDNFSWLSRSHKLTSHETPSSNLKLRHPAQYPRLEAWAAGL